MKDDTYKEWPDDKGCENKREEEDDGKWKPTCKEW